MNKLSKFALTLLAGSLLAGSAGAQEHVTGTVYQVEPNNIYVEASDHTAVKVPVASAVFRVRGVATDYHNLRMGSPVEAEYTPDSMMEPYEVIYVAPVKSERVYVREYKEDGQLVKEYRENGQTVRYVWHHGRWHRQ